MYHYTIIERHGPIYRLVEGLCWMALIGLALLPGLGSLPDGYAGWVTQPAVRYAEAPRRPRRRRHVRRRGSPWHFHWRAAWGYAGRSLQPMGWQLWLLVTLSVPLSVGAPPEAGPLGWWAYGILGLPVVRWGMAISAVAWPYWGQSGLCRGLRWGLYRLYQLTVLGLVGANLYHVGQLMASRWSPGWSGGGGLPLALGSVVREAKGWQVTIELAEDGTYEVRLTGRQGDTWFIRYRPVDEFDRRMFLLFLRHIWTAADTPARPFLRQEWLAAAFGVCQEVISRWQSYHRARDWRRLMSRRGGPLLSMDQICQIIAVWALNFWLTKEEVQVRLAAQGLEYSLRQIQEAGQLSGFLQVRRRLCQMLRFTEEGPQWRDGLLIGRLFELNETLITRLEAGQGLTPQLTLEVESLKQVLGAPVTALKKPLPLAYRLQQALFGQWQAIEEEGSVQCPHCGGSQVSRKGRKPERKRYKDPQSGQWCEVEGHRYFCHDAACPFGTFTDYPEGVPLHSHWTVETMIWGVMVYMHMRTTYRRAADAVGVSHVTLWRWAMLIGQQSLPIAALFGMVHCSGVVGIDEKWVLVPKNDKPAGKHKRWMYVYLAVDVYTYDLLHIEIYPYNGKAQARAFLQALKAKGYQPHVIITDMNQDYTEPIQQVFSEAEHHECVFHALQWAQRLIKEVYGTDYAEKYPKAEDLKQRIYKLLDAKTKCTVDKRYRAVMELKDQYVAQMPEAERIFNFLERHYPKLVNAVENPLIPLTNNTVELVIRRFDQHYQNMCGFDSIETARAYLNLFELVYRFTPFVQDNRPVKGRELDIRGKCPLELAGYDISHMPIAQIMRARILGLPPKVIQQQLVPNP